METIIVMLVLVGAWLWLRRRRRKARAVESGNTLGALVRGVTRRGHDDTRGGTL